LDADESSSSLLSESEPESLSDYVFVALRAFFLAFEVTFLAFLSGFLADFEDFLGF